MDVLRLLLTGFAPFGGESINPSWLVANALAEAPPEGVAITAVELPIDPCVARDVLLPEWRRRRFDAWLGLGQAGGRSSVNVERVAVNLLQDPVASGAETRVLDGEPDGYVSRLAVAELARSIRDAGVQADVSYSAGTYLCNATFYAMEHEQRRDGRGCALFVHLPYVPEQAAGKPASTATLAFELQLRGVRAAIEWLRDRAASP